MCVCVSVVSSVDRWKEATRLIINQPSMMSEGFFNHNQPSPNHYVNRPSTPQPSQNEQTSEYEQPSEFVQHVPLGTSSMCQTATDWIKLTLKNQSELVI